MLKVDNRAYIGIESLLKKIHKLTALRLAHPMQSTLYK
jgi:hypothetical protein